MKVIVSLAAWFSLVVCAEAQDRLPQTARNRGFPGLTREREGRWKGPFFFIQLADPQFGFMKDPAQEVRNAERAVEHVNRLKPRFVVVCGDLTHPDPGAKGYESERSKFVRIFSKVDASIPLICVAGNHDVGGDSDPAKVKVYKRHFGDDYFSFWAGGIRCVVINSSLFGAAASDAQEAQDRWFEGELRAARKAKPKHLLFFQHHSWFLKNPDEKSAYFNIRKERRLPALAVMKQAGVRAVFAGHYHGNAYGKDGTLEMVTSGPVGKTLRKDPSGLRIVEVLEDRIRHRYYALDEAPKAVELPE